MKSIFEFSNYRPFIKHVFSKLSKNGFGQSAKLARALGVHNTFISQVLNGDKSFNAEQGLTAAEFLNLNVLETEYLVLLIQLERAGTQKYRDYLQAKIKKVKARSERLSNRVTHEITLSEEHRAIFYTDWVYSAVRLSTLLPECRTPDAITNKLSLPPERVRNAITFLIQAGLLKLEQGTLTIGPLTTHLDGGSPWIKPHHANWRQKALESVSRSDPSSLHYSSPMTLSREDIKRVRDSLLTAVSQINEITDPSPSEELMCLNIDWFAIC